MTRNKKLVNQILLIFASILGLLIVVVVGYELIFWGKIFPGVNVVGVDLGTKTQLEAETVLAQIADDLDNKLPAIVLSNNGNTWHILKADVNFRYLPEAAAYDAFLTGRGGNLIENFVSRFRLLYKAEGLDFQYLFDQAILESSTATVAAMLDVPPVLPEIKVLDSPAVDESKVEVIEGESGEVVEKELLYAEIDKRLSKAETLEIEIPIKIVDFDISDDEIQLTKQRAEEFVDKNMVIRADEHSWQLHDQEMVNLMDFKNGFLDERIRSLIEGWAKSIDRLPQDAAFQYVGGRVMSFKTHKDGLQLDQEGALPAIVQALESAGDPSTGSGQESQNLVVTLEVIKTQPEVTLDEVNNLGIKELLGRGSSTYRGSIAGRVYNVGLSANRINGALVKPGEEFSFNATVGEVSGVTGYKPSYVIKQGATVLDDGGGVCQTSTTTFRAALNAGLPITARRAHSYRVGYYEQNAKAGLDATVYSPTTDLRFVNDTGHHLLIQTIVNSGSRALTVEIYGTSDGRQGQILNHRVWDIVPAPPPRYQDDPSLAPGQLKQVDYAATGAKAKFDYVVTRGGETITSKTFYSNFQPWQAVYLRGI